MPIDLTAELIRKARAELTACEREPNSPTEARLGSALALTLAAVEEQQQDIARLKRRTRWLP